MPILITALAALLCHAAMTSLSLAMSRHYEQLTGQRSVPPLHRHLLRAIGWGLLLLAAVACVQGLQVGVGLAAWCGLVGVAALGVACGLSYRPRLTAQAAVGTLVVGLVGLGLVWMLAG